jgi:ATP-dependent RNA helicase RhlE
MTFNDFDLSDELIRAIQEEGYLTPTPVQQQAIPVVLGGYDMMVGAQTGTGKTAGFTLPLLQLLSKKHPAKKAIRALILTPTRELAAQVSESVNKYGKYLPLKVAVIFGGVPLKPQIALLKQGVDIVVATPGRLLDHVNQKNIDLSKIEILVLDEADRMLDMGFIADIRKVVALAPKQRQNLLFSATFSEEIKKLAATFLKNAKVIEVNRINTTAERISQKIYPVDNKRKSELLSHLILSNKWKQVLIFTRTKHGANRLAQFLDTQGIQAAAIHGNKSQSARTKALVDFKQGSISALVATDIAARGLDIDQLPHVVNFELPNVAEDYVHRIGRTGRAGCEGEAISLVCIDEESLLTDIEKLLKGRLPKVLIKGFEPNPNIKAEPIFRGRMQKSSSKGSNPAKASSSTRPFHSKSPAKKNTIANRADKKPF